MSENVENIPFLHSCQIMSFFLAAIILSRARMYNSFDMIYILHLEGIKSLYASSAEDRE